MKPTCDKCKQTIDSKDTETLLVISAELGMRYTKFLCGICGKEVKNFLES